MISIRYGELMLKVHFGLSGIVYDNLSHFSLSFFYHTVAYEELLDDHKLEGDFFSLLPAVICV